MRAKDSVAVVIPVYNEERLISKTLEGIPSLVHSIIVVDDASTDKTAEIVKDCMKQDKRISLIRHKKNGGVGKALSSGYRVALEGNADIIVVVNGDCQMDPKNLPAIIKPILSNKADYVHGNRFGKSHVLWRMPFQRLVGNLAISTLVSIAAGKILRDVTSGYTAITRQALSSLDLEEIFPRYGVPIDILLKLSKKRWRIRQVPTQTIYKGSTSGIRTVPYARAILGIIRDNYGQKK